MTAEAEREFDYADLPIDGPSQDLFGVDDFVSSLSRSLRKMKSPKGVVIALNGPWGSGKSSAINLLKHHLSDPSDVGDLQVVEFNPWWFRGEEALVLAFFRELYAATKPSLGDKARKILPKLGARLLKAGSIVAPVADAAGASGAGSIASGVMGWLGGMIEDGESVEKLHAELGAALSAQDKRFIILIDDIDRLAPDEALAMFRLVKSVGRLPNVIYVLAFDRLLAERMVSERFPSEGPQYLEKIVQASFELPPPLERDLQQLMISNISEIAGVPDEHLIVHVMNMFHEVLAPEIHTPRDAIRFINAFSITWPSVSGEVDLGDFLALETYRLFRPTIYHAIRSNQSLVVGSAQTGLGRPDLTAEQLDARLLASEVDRERFRRGLMRLFPKLASIWSNIYHDATDWDKQRRACSAQHFQTYFRLSLSSDTISSREIHEFMERAGDSEWVSTKLRDAVATLQHEGRTRAALLLDAWILHGSELPLDKAEGLLAGVFNVADEIDVKGDHARGFSFGSNSLRIHWLMRSVLFGRTDLSARAPVIMAAARSASLGWLANLARSAWDDYHPREGEECANEDKCLVTEANASVLIEMAVAAVVLAGEQGRLLEHASLATLLYVWRDFGGDEGAAVKSWTATQLANDHSVASLARAFTSDAWGHAMGGFGGLGDLVSKRSDRAQISTLDSIMDRATFRARLETLNANQIADNDDADAISRLLKAWDNQDRFGH